MKKAVRIITSLTGIVHSANICKLVNGLEGSHESVILTQEYDGQIIVGVSENDGFTCGLYGVYTKVYMAHGQF